MTPQVQLQLLNPQLPAQKHGMVLVALKAERLETSQQQWSNRAVFIISHISMFYSVCSNAVKDGTLPHFINSSILQSTKSLSYDFGYIPYSRHRNMTRLLLQDKWSTSAPSLYSHLSLTLFQSAMSPAHKLTLMSFLIMTFMVSIIFCSSLLILRSIAPTWTVLQSSVITPVCTIGTCPVIQD